MRFLSVCPMPPVTRRWLSEAATAAVARACSNSTAGGPAVALALIDALCESPSSPAAAPGGEAGPVTTAAANSSTTLLRVLAVHCAAEAARSSGRWDAALRQRVRALRRDVAPEVAAEAAAVVMDSDSGEQRQKSSWVWQPSWRLGARADGYR